MWGFLAKAGAWALAHKNEILAGIQVWKALRNKRKKAQAEGEGVVDYYKRTGKKTVVDGAARILVEEDPGE